MKPNLKKFILISFLLLTVSICVFPLYIFYYENRLNRAFDLINIGDTLKKVTSIAGTPRYTTDGSRWVEPSFEKSKDELTPNVIIELWYEAKFNPLPSKWSFEFDSNNKLLAKHQWGSW